MRLALALSAALALAGSCANAHGSHYAPPTLTFYGGLGYSDSETGSAGFPIFALEYGRFYIGGDETTYALIENETTDLTFGAAYNFDGEVDGILRWETSVGPFDLSVETGRSLSDSGSYSSASIGVPIFLGYGQVSPYLEITDTSAAYNSLQYDVNGLDGSTDPSIGLAIFMPVSQSMAIIADVSMTEHDDGLVAAGAVSEERSLSYLVTLIRKF